MTSKYRETNTREWNMFHVIALRRHGIEDLDIVGAFGEYVYKYVEKYSSFPSDRDIDLFFKYIKVFGIRD